MTAVAGPVGGGSHGGGTGPGWTLDLSRAVGGMSNPLIVWLITTTGGLLLFLVLVRRWRDDSDPTVEGRALAVALAGPAVTTESMPPSPPAAPAPRPTGRATMLPPVPPRTFDKPPANGVERARIGYRRVRISSKPDAVRSVELGRLDRGDEVEVLDSYEGFLQIRTPDDITGWILRHTTVGAPTD